MNNFDQVEREVMQAAVFRYEQYLRHQAREHRSFLKNLKEIGLYSNQEDEVRETISECEQKRELCREILKRL